MKTGVSLAALAAVLALAATAQAQPKTTPAPRGSDGHPALSGVWTNASVTNLTRPPGLKLAVGKAEADALVKANPFQRLIEAEEGPSDLDDELLDDGNSDRGYNAFWLDPGSSLAVVKGEFRTSWIVDPADGQVPLSVQGKARVAAARAERQARLFTGPEALSSPERCLIGFSGAGGPGMLNTIYNNNYQIVQTPDSVVIVVEMVHDARTIPIVKDKASARHGPAELRPWLGDSVAWWEGDALVIETVHVNPLQGQSGPIFLSAKGKVTERLTRVSGEQIFYEFQVEDPVYYTQPWRAELSLNVRDERMFEYACHEGNYALPGMLAGARAEEAAAAKAKPAAGGSSN